MNFYVQGVGDVDCLVKPNHTSCIQLHFTQEQVGQMRENIIGITPVIINIQPIINLPLLSGLDFPKDDDDDSDQHAKGYDFVAVKEGGIFANI
ncbi:MAG: hypothetical protein ACI9E5_000988 [Candidatus Omnitrophota bacterium]|jgi:hypothetical protein